MTFLIKRLPPTKNVDLTLEFFGLRGGRERVDASEISRNQSVLYQKESRLNPKIYIFDNPYAKWTFLNLLTRFELFEKKLSRISKGDKFD